MTGLDRPIPFEIHRAYIFGLINGVMLKRFNGTFFYEVEDCYLKLTHRKTKDVFCFHAYDRREGEIALELCTDGITMEMIDNFNFVDHFGIFKEMLDRMDD